SRRMPSSSLLLSGPLLVLRLGRVYLVLLDPVLQISAENSPVTAPANPQFKTLHFTILEEQIDKAGVAMQVLSRAIQRHDFGPSGFCPCAPPLLGPSSLHSNSPSPLMRFRILLIALCGG